MKDRIIKFLTSENKSSAQFAEEIGVQPSGVSHILSGRNNPSLDFVLKMLNRYSYISTEWLLFGKEPMYRGHSQPTLFDSIDEPDKGGIQFMEPLENDELASGNSPDAEIVKNSESVSIPGPEKGGIDRIVFFYADNSFEEYRPSEKK